VSLFKNKLEIVNINEKYKMNKLNLDNLQSEIRQIFVEVTRYPEEILTVDAHLEQDLGIDSVKLAEIFAVIGERYQLPAPEDLDIGREDVSNIVSLTRAIEPYLNANKQSTSTDMPSMPTSQVVTNNLNGVSISTKENSLEKSNGFNGTQNFATNNEAINQSPTNGQLTENLHPAPEVTKEEQVAKIATTTANQSGVNLDLDINVIKEKVRSIFAEVTRYPIEILELNANLEEDLGIDSVKLAEIFAVMIEEFQLPPFEELDFPRESARSMTTIAEALFQIKQDQYSSSRNVQDLSNETGNVAQITTHSIADVSKVTEQNTPPVNKIFTGKIVLVTGSGRGVGKDIACYLAELGATVIVNSFHSRDLGEQTAQQIIDNGGKAIHIWGSVANAKHIDQIFNQIESQFGVLDYFISNASNGKLASLEDITVEDWEKAYRTNVIGLHQCSLRAVKLMSSRKQGKIITMSSPASQFHVDFFGCMGSVKAAVESLTRSMACEFAKYNVQVNCVSPGPVHGDLIDRWPNSDAMINRWRRQTPYKRLCEAKDISHFIAYLLGDGAQLFNGSTLVMDGGVFIKFSEQDNEAGRLQ